ncbi:MAG TPA: hypothetical protein H9870_08940 [Candidatus Corynebacterium avicola]|uniref:Uncharacterized protein n=1 Tax=Candidatus Corynebacterium avicola TaxID=2838527 RepID=A0A9D1UMA2_9CORY|nr:hypothetical protein [Candidatus Corynebacterium avicola]
MNIDYILANANDLLGQADWLAFRNWDSVSRVLDSVIPNAWSNYTPRP